jgi:membrane peptidoglycan carboxypeptidase
MPFGRGRGDEAAGGPRPKSTRSAKAKKARRRNILIASVAVVIMLTGAGFVGGTYYVDSVREPNQLNFPSTTTVYYSDGVTEMARLGEFTRYELQFAELNDAVKDAIVASEDTTFWTNEGVDFKGVMRAAWNNFTGGEQQGGSTITQQYARVAFELQGSTYSRKLREAVMAWKISDKYKKEDILAFYLNSVPFGRQAYGVEAAAKSFLNKTVKKTAPPEQQVTLAEAMALVLMVKQPNPDPADPVGSPGYDPTVSTEALALASDRWTYVRKQLVEMGKLTQADADKMVYPKDSFKPADHNAGNGLDKPTGLVVNHAISELTHFENSPFKGHSWKSIREGGYKITTTIDAGAQRAAEAAADEQAQGSAMFGQPENLQAAIVGVQPGTGRVLAYFGGHDGEGSDFAGFYWDESGEANGVGRHPPGSSFKVYTLAAALRAGVSLNTYWPWTPHDMPNRTGKNQIRNASNCTADLDAAKKPKNGACTLLDSTVASLNVPFYAVTVAVTPQKVLEMARDAGIDYMWSDNGRQDLTKVKTMNEMFPSQFDYILGIGQYPVSVTDHANGIATFAADGVRAQAHFVKEVRDSTNQLRFGEQLKVSKPLMNQQQIADLDFALSQIPSAKLPNLGWATAGKTGTWEWNQSESENAHAWMVGYTKKLAAAVWVGNEKEEKSLRDKSGGVVWGSGIPTNIWKAFMTNATKAMNEAKKDTNFRPKAGVGREDFPGSISSPTPAPPTAPADPGQPTLPIVTVTPYVNDVIRGARERQ